MNKSVNVLLAAVSGFVAGLLLAPKSGAETREEIRTKAREAKERMDEKASDAADMVKDGAARAEAEARGMAESARKSVRSITGETHALGHEARERVNRTAADAKEAAKR